MNNRSDTPRGVRWLRGVALVALLGLPLAVLVVRAGPWQAGLMLYAGACLLSVLVFAIAALCCLLPRLSGSRAKLALAALLALPGTVLLATLVAGRGDYPPIHDIATDLDSPPTFRHASALRGLDANPLDIKPETQATQRTAYPDIRPLDSTLAPEAAYRHALATARRMDWEVVYEDRRDGNIEAVATTPIMGFRDDIVIRLRPLASGGTRVDLRSISRVGVGDLGANATRIRAFIRQFQQQEQSGP